MAVSKEIMRSTLRQLCKDRNENELMSYLRILSNETHYPYNVKYSFHPYTTALFVYVEWSDNPAAEPYTRYTEDEVIDLMIEAGEARKAKEAIDSFQAYSEKDAANDDLKNRFTYHKPKDGQPDIYVKIREKALELGVAIDRLVPDCPEKVHAIDKIDEAVMWANAGVSRHEC